jgi:hypothetical protein
MEHTPKNILIRAVKRKKNTGKADSPAFKKTEEFMHATPTLETLLFNE